MGVNVRAQFSAGTRVNDVATVAAILLGAEPRKSMFNLINSDGGYSAKVTGVKVVPNNYIATMVDIVVPLNPENPLAAEIIKTDGNAKGEYWLSYHFESGPMGEPLIMPKNTPAKIALSKALVKFFGGTIDFNDSDNSELDFKSPRKSDISATDGKPWYSLQDRILAVKPLTQKDMDAVAKFAAY
jgi:hypothetical protein